MNVSKAHSDFVWLASSCKSSHWIPLVGRCFLVDGLSLFSSSFVVNFNRQDVKMNINAPKELVYEQNYELLPFLISE